MYVMFRFHRLSYQENARLHEVITVLQSDLTESKQVRITYCTRHLPFDIPHVYVFTEFHSECREGFATVRHPDLNKAIITTIGGV